MKNKNIIITILFLILISIVNISFSITKNEIIDSTNLDSNTISDIKSEIKNTDLENVSQDDILNLYDKIINTYDTNDVANIIEDNKDLIVSQGIDPTIIDTSVTILKTTDSSEIREILDNNIDIESIKNDISNGVKPSKIISNVISDIPSNQKVSIFSNLLFANYIIKAIIIFLIICFIYRIILRWIIFKKAGLHGFGAIIPIYNQILKYKICDISPWIIMLWFIPFIGWGILLVTSIVMKFVLASNFKKGFFFGLGLLILPLIFESILAFNSNIKYNLIDESNTNLE